MKSRVSWVSTLLSMMIFCLLWTPGVAETQHKVAFVTSVSGAGNIGDATEWPDNNGLSGLSAADAVCQNRAAAAGLSNSGDFVAWLSDSTNDAYCRVHNLTGEKAANCGQPTLPESAGPWVRTDGKPFAESIDQALMPEGRVYRPIAFDEFGVLIGAYTLYFTATDPEGVSNPASTCSDWSVTSGWTYVGQNNGTIVNWTSAGTGECSTHRPLLCLEAGGAGPDLLFVPQAGAGVFLTSVAGSGDLGSWPEAGIAEGLAAGDAICRTLAGNAGLHAPESFVAWLSDASENAADRVTGDGPWVRPDGVMIASGRADLTNDSTILSSIHVTETYQYEFEEAFTGTTYLGLGTSNHCGNWTNGTSGDGAVGISGFCHSNWTNAAADPCSDQRRLYCFSNSNSWPFFSDSFESGDLRWWSAVVGE